MMNRTHSTNGFEAGAFTANSESTLCLMPSVIGICFWPLPSSTGARPARTEHVFCGCLRQSKGKCNHNLVRRTLSISVKKTDTGNPQVARVLKSQLVGFLQCAIAAAASCLAPGYQLGISRT